MIDAPKVAVIICAYNMARYLPESLDSALLLRYPNLQIIVVDDGSKDGTKELIQERYAKRITYMYQENSGLFAARKAGITAAGDADYYSILDADDIIHPLKVHDEVAFLQRFTDVAICFSNLFIFSKEGKAIGSYWNGSNLIGKNKLYGKIEDPIEKIARFKAFTSLSTIRASAYHQIGGYDSTLKCSGDLDLAIRLTRAGGIGFINKLRYLYRHDDHGMTSYMCDRIVAIMKIFDKVRASSSDYTREELSWLTEMGNTFLMQALWGTYLGSVDSQLKNMIRDRLRHNNNVTIQIKSHIIQCIGMLRLARIVSKFRSTRAAQRNESENKLSLQNILEDMLPCFDGLS
jgi:glycosyltransferase involved in cell wall biosynthesis